LHEFLLPNYSSENLEPSANNQLRHIAPSLLQPCSSLQNRKELSANTQHSSIAPFFAAKMQQLGESESISQYSTE
jgi:hypothetical protein